jgi:hypothetical protein
MNSTKTKDPVWDRANSTYMRVIYLCNGISLVGYSKKYALNERTDKVELLQNWILRDYKVGYLDRKTTNPKITPLDRIEYLIKHNETYYPVINLYYEFPEWVNQKWMDNKKFFYFIKRFYEMIRQGEMPSTIVNALEIRTRASSKDPFDLTCMRFPFMPDLNAYAHRLRLEGKYADEAIENFYRKYIEKYFKKPQ